MGTKLERIAEISATTPKPEFTSLYHLINAERGRFSAGKHYQFDSGKHLYAQCIDTLVKICSTERDRRKMLSGGLRR